VHFDLESDLEEEEVIAIMSLARKLVVHPLVRIKLTVPVREGQIVSQSHGDPNMDVPGDAIIKVVEQIATSQQALEHLTISCIDPPMPHVSLACNAILLRMNSLKTVAIELQLSLETFTFLSRLPFLESLHFTSFPKGLKLQNNNPISKCFFPALQTLKIVLNSSKDLSVCPVFLGVISSASLRRCLVEIDFPMNPRLNNIHDLVTITNALASTPTLLWVGLHNASGGGVQYDASRLRELVAPLLPLASASGGAFRLSFKGLYFDIRDEDLTKTYQYLQFAIFYQNGASQDLPGHGSTCSPTRCFTG
jgi:hypothetical protein